MKYYQHHIGDFDKATRHLSRIERSIYLDLIFHYYDTEKPLTLEVAVLCRKIVARDDAEKNAVLAVLDEFFVETPAGWFNDRCEEELAKYRATTSQASAAGKASAVARAERRRAAMGSSTCVVQPLNENPTTVEQPLNERVTDSQPDVNELSTNQKPLTTIQEPVKSKTKAEPSSPLPDWLPIDAWIGYLEMRKKQKKVPTDRAVALVLSALDAMRRAGQDITAVLDRSTKNNWVDVYAIREENNRTGPPAQKFDPVAYVNRNRLQTTEVDDDRTIDI